MALYNLCLDREETGSNPEKELAKFEVADYLMKLFINCYAG